MFRILFLFFLIVSFVLLVGCQAGDAAARLRGEPSQSLAASVPSPTPAPTDVPPTPMALPPEQVMALVSSADIGQAEHEGVYTGAGDGFLMAVFVAIVMPVVVLGGIAVLLWLAMVKWSRGGVR